MTILSWLRHWDWRRTRLCVLGMMAAGGGALATLVLITPSVRQAPHLIAAVDGRHGSIPAQIEPTEHIALAVVAAEDERFFSHHGVDTLGVVRALWGAVVGQDLGGSTIDQQLAKTLYTRGDAGLFSRAQQLALALKFEGHYTKAAILSMYLSAIYFGNNDYGIVAASRGYFGKAPSQLTWAQATLLAGLPFAPSALNPFHHLNAAKRRQRYVLNRLVAGGQLTAVQADVVFAAPLGLLPH